MPDTKLVYSNGSREGIAVFIPQKKQVNFCLECGYWIDHKCRIGYVTNAKMSACKQAIEQTAKRGF